MLSYTSKYVRVYDHRPYLVAEQMVVIVNIKFKILRGSEIKKIANLFTV